MKLLEMKKVGKRLYGKEILKDINYQFCGGEVCGLRGRNGSGKTMTLRTLSGLLKPTEGEVLYQGEDIYSTDSVDLNIGLVVDGAGLYPELTGRMNLQRLAAIRKQISIAEIDMAIQRVGLNPEDKRTYAKYSLGMRQRILIAQAIMEKPEILLLDEPTNGLDEQGVGMVRDIVIKEAERGAVVVIASHNKEDINLLCNRVYELEGEV